jgi:hypothetical protein
MMQLPIKHFLELAELNRREQPTVDTKPLQEEVCVGLRRVTGKPETDLFDYSVPCNGIDAAIHHLDEGLPIGQKQRVAAAFNALEYSVEELKLWLTAKGYL